jgi:VanZ family protein
MNTPPPRKPIFATLWLVLFAGYLLALFAGTHLPRQFASPSLEKSDKLVHFAAYAGLAWLLAMAWQSTTGRLNRRHLWFAWLAIVGFAAVDEVTQLLVHRDASSIDWLADVLGSATGLIVFTITRRLF